MQDILREIIRTNSIYKMGIEKVKNNSDDWKFMAEIGLIRFAMSTNAREVSDEEKESLPQALKESFQYIATQV